ncbi:hypothetical protein MMC11_002943 [Xylographa trunciseda]|nr:hypothetical protein [Xylographa trunciseda]
MPFFTSTLLKASLVALLSAGYVKATPIPAAPGYSSQNGPTPGVSVSGFSYTGLNMQNGTDLHHRGNSNETAPASLVKRTTGDIEAHWQFSDLETVCGDFGAVCFSPSAHLWVNWYANGNSNPTCSDYWDITIESSSNQLSGKPFYSQNCDIYVIFDGNGNGVGTTPAT